MSKTTATFLMSDVESSTPLWEQHPHEMRIATEQLDALVESVAQLFGGSVIKDRGEGDSHFVVFPEPSSAVCAALALQDSVRNAPWPPSCSLKLRLAVHTGEVLCRHGDFYGSTVNRCARIRAAAHGGQTLVSGIAASLSKGSLPEDARLSDLGQHRLRDLLEPIRIFQLTSTRVSETFPPLRSLRSDRTNLPMQLTSFVGREAETQKIATLLETKRILTLVGPGGSGKTRLALQVGADVVDTFEDGVWFVSLVSQTEQSGVPSAVASALGISADPAGDAVTSTAEEFREKRALIILDNCEHLGDAPAHLVSKLVKSCLELRVMSTSRRGLGLAGETLFSVPPLEIPDLDNAPNPDAVGSTESVRLLLERATAKAPEFRFGEANAWQVGQLCAALEGMPLAIELAAPKLRLLSPERIVQLLREDLGGLEAADLDVDPRHKTLRSAIAWSFAQLSEGTRRSLALLSCFPAGFTLQIAESVLGSGAISSLEELIDNSLVQTHHENAGEPRYRILETIRQYVEESCDPAWLAEAAEKRYSWALEFARRTKPELLGASQETTLSLIHAEYDNLRATLEWSEGQPADRELLVPLAANLDRFWHRKGLIRDGRNWLERALAREQSACGVEVAVARRSAGIFCNLQGDAKSAYEHLQSALEACKVGGDETELAATLVNISLVQIELGLGHLARENLLEANFVYERLGDKTRMALILQNLGALDIDCGRFEEARDTLLKAYNLLTQLGDRWGEATTLTNLGSASLQLDSLQSAQKWLKLGIERWRDLGDPASLSQIIRHIATLASKAEHHQLAATLAFGVRELWRRSGLAGRQHEELKIVEILERASAELPEPELSRIERMVAGLSSEEIVSLGADALELFQISIP